MLLWKLFGGAWRIFRNIYRQQQNNRELLVKSAELGNTLWIEGCIFSLSKNKFLNKPLAHLAFEL